MIPHIAARKRISGSKTFRSPPQKDFCNKICHYQTSTAQTLDERRIFNGTALPHSKQTDFADRGCVVASSVQTHTQCPLSTSVLIGSTRA